MQGLVHNIVGFLSSFSKEWLIFILSALPVTELRLSIPIGVYFLGKEAIVKIFLLSVLGNTVFVAPVLVLLNPVSAGLRKLKFFRTFFDWMAERTKKKADLIQKYEALGLALFVAVPLPGTGAWTGCLAASLFKIKFRYAFLSIAIGVILAGIIVSLLSVAGVLAWGYAR